MARYRPIILLTTGIVILLSWASFAGLLRPVQQRVTDLLFVRRQPLQNIKIIAIDDKSIRDIGQWPWPRATFGTLISNLQNAAVIGIDVNFKEPSRFGIHDDTILANAISKSSVPIVLSAEMQKDGTLSPVSIPDNGTYSKGYPNLPIGTDSIVRFVTYTTKDAPSFANAVVQASRVSYQLPPKTQSRIDFVGPNNTYPSVSASDVLTDQVPQKFYENAIVLLGATAKDLHDYHATPFGSMSGVEVQANVIATLLRGRWYQSHEWITIALIAILAALTAWITTRIQRIRTLIASFVGVIFIYSIIAFVSFDFYYILDLLYPTAAVVFTAGITITYQYFTAAQEKRFIQETFSRYLAPQVINQLMHEPSKLKLGGTREILTILFSDIRNFTSLSENMMPEELTAFLNDYLSQMTNAILRHQGLVDKYIGDSIMAFWGAPLSDSQHALHGVCAALDMVDLLEQFNISGSQKRYPYIDIGIGINSGEVTVGNMGSETRFDYTAMGDNVNLASRLEGLTKTYGVRIIIADSIASAIPEDDRRRFQIMLRELDRVQVKGKKRAVTIFEAVPRGQQESIAHIASTFASARDAYYEGRWRDAISGFSHVLEYKPNDLPSQVLKDRCSGFLHRPVENWQGVFEITQK